MYKVFINEKPLFFLEDLESFTLTEGSGVVEFSELSSLEELMDFHEDNLTTVVIGDDQEWTYFGEWHEVIHAGGGLVKNDEDEFLFIFRNEKWDLPKGKLDDGELIERCAVREVEEECGINSPIISSHLLDTYHTYFHEGNWVLKKSCWFQMDYAGSETLTPQLEEGITKVEWLTELEWNKVMMNTYGTIQDVLEEYFNL
ncbi:MAG: NUDIX domain-containing protein [Flavobacteriales bacterium]|nr:NUDIX domain-containing protein [Flavobacteriales bacterium]